MPAFRGKPGIRKRHALQLFKTDLCRFFAQGHCENGDNCPYAHKSEEVRGKPDLSRTSMCKVLTKTGSCTDKMCRFAHAESQLRATQGFFKMKMCSFIQSGRCRHGNKCRFAHTADELRPPNPDALFPVTEDSGRFNQQDVDSQADTCSPSSETCQTSASAEFGCSNSDSSVCEDSSSTGGWGQEVDSHATQKGQEFDKSGARPPSSTFTEGPVLPNTGHMLPTQSWDCPKVMNPMDMQGVMCMLVPLEGYLVACPPCQGLDPNGAPAAMYPYMSYMDGWACQNEVYTD